MKFNRLKLIFFALVVTLIIVFLIFTIPKNVIRLAVHASSMQEDGTTPKSATTRELESTLLKRGVRLIYVKQDVGTDAPSLEFIVNTNQADMAFTPNTGATFPAEVTDKFSSMGTISRVGIFFLTKDKVGSIRKVSDLRGKRIVLWSSPENGKKPAFTTPDFKSSPYSTDRIIEELFDIADISTSNTNIKNVWPEKIKFNDNWDVWLAFANPGKITRDSLSHSMYDELMSGKVKYLSLNDLQGASKKLPFLSYQTLPASTVSLANAVPDHDIPYLSTTMSLVVRNDLDPSLSYALADAMRSVYSASSLLAKKDEFPNFDTQESFPPNQYAARLYKHEAPFLLDYLSPSIYTIVTKLITLALPLLTILWPLMNLIPRAYKFYVKHKITQWYKDLEEIEKKYPTATTEERLEHERHLNRVQDGLTMMKLPVMHLHYVQEIFAAKAHVDLIRRRIAATNGQTTKP